MNKKLFGIFLSIIIVSLSFQTSVCGLNSSNNEVDNEQIKEKHDITIIGQCSGGSVFNESLGQYVNNLSISFHFKPFFKSFFMDLILPYELVENYIWTKMTCVSLTLDGKTKIYPHSIIILEDFSGYLPTYDLWRNTSEESVILSKFIPMIVKGTCNDCSVYMAG